MPIKPNLPPRPAHALSGFSLLAIEGPDAAAFLQAQLMNDVMALAPRQWQWNGWLSAKGRVIALFALVRLDPERYWLVLPDFPAAELLPLLQRYVFRSKLRLAVLEDWCAAAALDISVDGSEGRDRVAGEDDSGFELDLGGDARARSLRLLPRRNPDLAPGKPDIDQDWTLQDIAHGLPRLDVSQREAWTAQMLSLERLRAFSLKKGCYPGQEIVARTHYLGQAKRGLVRLRGQGLRPGQALSGPEGKLGSIVCASADGLEALAVLPAGLDPGLVLVNDAGACVPLPLQDGLARPR